MNTQVTELEAEFEKLGNEKPMQTRFLRSQQDLKAKMEARLAAGEEDAEGWCPPRSPFRLIVFNERHCDWLCC